MTILETMYKEVRRDQKHFRSGKIAPEEFLLLLKGHKAQMTLTGQMLQVWALIGNLGDKYAKHIFSSGLISRGTIIDISTEEIEEEKIFCPLKKEHITRAACLDFSGEEKNHEDCKGCDAGLENKKLLLDRPIYTA
jgi:hypothetical protein